jgi:hypothetical protein
LSKWLNIWSPGNSTKKPPWIWKESKFPLQNNPSISCDNQAIYWLKHSARILQWLYGARTTHRDCLKFDNFGEKIQPIWRKLCPSYWTFGHLEILPKIWKESKFPLQNNPSISCDNQAIYWLKHLHWKEFFCVSKMILLKTNLSKIIWTEVVFLVVCNPSMNELWVT